MKKYHFYSVSLGYSSIALVKIKSIFDLYFIFQYSPSGSTLGKLAFIYRLIISVFLRNRVQYEIHEVDYYSCSSFILIPWSQSKDEKYCLITKKSFSKHSKSSRADSLLKNEYKGSVVFNKLINSDRIVVQVPKLSNDNGHISIEYPLLRAQRSQDICDFKFEHSNNCHDFFSTKYYLTSKRCLDEFLTSTYPDIYYELFTMLSNKKEIMVNVSPMHGDFSNSNLVNADGKLFIIDFEEYLEDGIDIEISYYKFRYQFDRNKVFLIKTDVDLLCVYHYLFFQAKNESHFTFENITLSNQELRLKL